MDKNSDGEITLEEYERFGGLKGEFTMTDSNTDGVFNKEEFETWWDQFATGEGSENDDDDSDVDEL